MTMADILEQMGFPKDLIELAIENSSGLEAAIELLIQFQTDGALSACSSQKVAESTSVPTLRLREIPGTITRSEVPAMDDNSERSCSPVTEALSSKTLAFSLKERVTELGYKRQTSSENPPGVYEELRSARTGRRKLSSESIHPETGKTSIVDNASTLVPDLIADERKRRVSAALLVKKENEIEKDRIRKQLKEDREMRNGRQNLVAQLKSEEIAAIENQVVGAKRTINGVIEIQIRCKDFPMIKASFSAEATLKDVRSFVQRELEAASTAPDLEVPERSNKRLTSFSGHGAKLTPSRKEELELLRVARDNFKVQTQRIISEAKSLRKNDSNQHLGKIYFLVPYPRKEFYTECSLNVTLSQAQFLPKETLIVEFRPEATTSQPSLSQVHHDPSSSQAPLAEVSQVTLCSSSSLFTEMASGITQHQSIHDYAPDAHPKQFHNSQSPELMIRNEVQMRELALQAAAARMKESAQLLREGFPPEKGKLNSVYHCSSNSENMDLDCERGSRKLVVGKVPAAQQSLQTEQIQTQGPRCLAYSQALLAAEARLYAAQCPAETLLDQKLSHPQSNVNRTCMSKAQLPASYHLLSRPEKMQKTADSEDLSESSGTKHASNQKGGAACANFHMFSEALRDDKSEGTSQKSSEMSFKNQVLENTELVAEEEIRHRFGASCSQGNLAETASTFSTLRIRLENGSVVTHKCRASTELQLIRDFVAPADPSSFGLVILFPEPRFMIGESLSLTVEQVGLVPRGTLHLSRVSTRGIVRQGIRNFQRHEPSTFFALRNEHNEYPEMQGPLPANYEELERFLESRVCVGVPEEILSALPTQIKEKKGVSGLPGESKTQTQFGEDEEQLCVVCIEGLVEGDSVLLLPCSHVFHSACIRQWLRQSRHCPTCKDKVI